MILRHTVATVLNDSLMSLPVSCFVKLFDHLATQAELEAAKLSYDIDSNAAYVRSCALITGAEFGQELSYADKLNILAVITEMSNGIF